jgi:PilZ domain
MRNGTERRQHERVRLAHPIVARLGLLAVVIIDASESGVLIEHYVCCRTGEEKKLRLETDAGEVSCSGRIVSCRVHRFASGDDGLTVCHSGFRFTASSDAFFDALRRMITAERATALVEQVANARGFLVGSTANMPIFRSGGLTSNDMEIAASANLLHLVPDNPIVRQAGYTRCTLQRKSWQKKWTLDPAQPEEGVTVSASEAPEQVDLLCQTYLEGDEETRKMIRDMARVTLEPQCTAPAEAPRARAAC